MLYFKLFNSQFIIIFQIEGKSSTTATNNEKLVFYPNTLVYIGGLPDLSKLPFNSLSGYPVPFRGCVRNLNINGTKLALNSSNILESRNIYDCDGTACGGDYCNSGGSCWLDDNASPHCKCPEYAKGLQCEIQEDCNVIKCKNKGTCMPDGHCSCGVGWTGYYCEIATSKYSTPSFRGRSYLMIPSNKMSNKDKRNGDSYNYASKMDIEISFNFSTIDDGLLFWMVNRRSHFFGIGIDNGYIKVVSNMIESDNFTTINEWNCYVSDGDWHNVKVETDHNSVLISIDGNQVFADIRLQPIDLKDVDLGHFVNSNDAIFIGKLKKIND